MSLKRAKSAFSASARSWARYSSNPSILGADRLPGDCRELIKTVDYNQDRIDKADMKRILLVCVIVLTGCDDARAPDPTPTIAGSSVTLRWNQNHEKGVNAVGGGYRLTYSTAPIGGGGTEVAVKLPYQNGALPTKLKIDGELLRAGRYYVQVTAYSKESTSATTSFEFVFDKKPPSPTPAPSL